MESNETGHLRATMSMSRPSKLQILREAFSCAHCVYLVIRNGFQVWRMSGGSFYVDARFHLHKIILDCDLQWICERTMASA